MNTSGAATYQLFSSILPGVPRSPDGEDRLSLAYDRSAVANLGGTYQFPTTFVDGPTLFGQGAEMRVRKFDVRRRVAGTGDGAG